ncbi:MAG: DNA adenine methylase [Coriobacteriia bacterium]|nr:DNA adenine methylase [Coriobacteriia bacterium]
MGFRYLGNKKRLADWIVDKCSERMLAGAVVADPMCGTATVSRAFADAGFRVLASDELRFPVLHAKAQLLPHDRCDFGVAGGSLESALGHLNSLPETQGFFWKEYSSDGAPGNGAKPRAYLTGSNAAKVDAMRAQIIDWQSEGMDKEAVDLLLHHLILAVNRVANIAGTYGYYRSSWSPASLSPIELRPYAQSPAAHLKHVVQQGRVEDIALKLDVELCYLDPPYTKRQYGGNYHLLETLAVQDEPDPVGEGGLRDWYPQSSAFCSKRKVRQALRETLKRLDSPYVALSYSEDGLVPPDEMWELLAQYGRVRREEAHLPRFRSNDGKSNKGGSVKEHLYLLERQ